MMKYVISTAMVIAATGNASAFCMLGGGPYAASNYMACQQQEQFQQQVLSNQQQMLQNQQRQGGFNQIQPNQIHPLNLAPGQLIVPRMTFGR
jgi:hypothetical protein